MPKAYLPTALLAMLGRSPPRWRHPPTAALRGTRSDPVACASPTFHRRRLHVRELATSVSRTAVRANQLMRYHTQDVDSLVPIAGLQAILIKEAPNFCKYAKTVHVFRMEAGARSPPF